MSFKAPALLPVATANSVSDCMHRMEQPAGTLQRCKLAVTLMCGWEMACAETSPLRLAIFVSPVVLVICSGLSHSQRSFGNNKALIQPLIYGNTLTSRSRQT